MAVDSDKETATHDESLSADPGSNSGRITGILPLIHIKHFFFGNALYSIPFFDAGGTLADDKDACGALVAEALAICKRVGAHHLELRHTHESGIVDGTFQDIAAQGYHITNLHHKVRMLLPLSAASDELMKGFKSKLRSQIRKPVKEGLKAKVGGVELLDDFYRVFTVNMRDLGSPVHSKRFIKKTIEQFADTARIIIVLQGGCPLACGIVIGFRDVLCNPWASALRAFSRLSPNMLLYWTMLSYACDSGYKVFDFGRSSPGSGTYKFKQQWGATPHQLQWQQLSQTETSSALEPSSQNETFNTAIKMWQKLPVPIATTIGPKIRKYIGL